VQLAFACALFRRQRLEWRQQMSCKLKWEPSRCARHRAASHDPARLTAAAAAVAVAPQMRERATSSGRPAATHGAARVCCPELLMSAVTRPRQEQTASFHRPPLKRGAPVNCEPGRCAHASGATATAPAAPKACIMTRMLGREPLVAPCRRVVRCWPMAAFGALCCWRSRPTARDKRRAGGLTAATEQTAVLGELRATTITTTTTTAITRR
jgi:hypothetical protein